MGYSRGAKMTRKNKLTLKLIAEIMADMLVSFCRNIVSLVFRFLKKRDLTTQQQLMRSVLVRPVDVDKIFFKKD
jgi:hypothetical protein